EPARRAHRPARPGEDGDTAGDRLDGGADDRGVLILLERAELAGPAGDEPPAGAGVDAALHVRGKLGHVDLAVALVGRDREEQQSVEHGFHARFGFDSRLTRKCLVSIQKLDRCSPWPSSLRLWRSPRSFTSAGPPRG